MTLERNLSDRKEATTLALGAEVKDRSIGDRRRAGVRTEEDEITEEEEEEEEEKEEEEREASRLASFDSSDAERGGRGG